MTPSDLARLIEKLEAASDGSRALDAEIGDAVGLHNVHWDEDDCFYALDLDEDHGPWLPVPAYSKSLDAALSLVPEGHHWAVSLADRTVAVVSRKRLLDPDEGAQKGATAPLALCIASLKARAALAEEK